VFFVPFVVKYFLIKKGEVNINSKKTAIILVTLLAVAVIVFFYFFQKATPSKKPENNAIKESISTNFTYGNTGKCRGVPKFISSLQLKTPALDSRQNDGSMGLQIRDYSKKNKVWQHKSWSMTGYIGAFERDNEGNIFVTPLPYVSLQKNPPEQQNRLYVVDSKTAEMSLFMTLPSKNKPDAKNPFGIMGLFFDCDTQSLYVSSVAGSTPREEKGVIFQIDVKTKKILSKLEQIDAVGLGTFNTVTGKRLYFGSARDSSLYSVALDQKGRFIESKSATKQYELSLSQLEGGDTTIIKKLKFKKRNNSFTMTLQDMEFGYRLMAENRAFKKNYHFEFNKNKDQWDFKGVSQY